jgi:MFS family permease
MAPPTRHPRRYYILGLIWLIYTFSILDRYVLSILAEPVKRDLNLSDTMLGFLIGPVFGLFYSVFAIPVAQLADRFSRRNVIAISLTLWSVFTAACGMAATATQLILARLFIGIGEAGSSPPAQSLLSDIFPPKERGRALGFMASSINLGIVLGFVLSGLISAAWGWRAAFIVLGVPGVLLALLLVLTVKEPTRGQADGRAAEIADEKAPGFLEVARTMWRNLVIRHLIIAGTLAVTAVSTTVVWLPAYLIRSFQLSESTVGTALGLLIGALGFVGTAAVGWVSDRIGQGSIRGRLVLASVLMCVVFPFLVAALMTQAYAAVLALLAVPGLLMSAPLGLSWAVNQTIMPVRMRATAAAVGVLISNIGGLVVGPQMVGIGSDFLGRGDATAGLRQSLLIVSMVFLWSALHYGIAARRIRSSGS